MLNHTVGWNIISNLWHLHVGYTWLGIITSPGRLVDNCVRSHDASRDRGWMTFFQFSMPKFFLVKNNEFRFLWFYSSTFTRLMPARNLLYVYDGPLELLHEPLKCTFTWTCQRLLMMIFKGKWKTKWLL